MKLLNNLKSTVYKVSYWFPTGDSGYHYITEIQSPTPTPYLVMNYVENTLAKGCTVVSVEHKKVIFTLSKGLKLLSSKVYYYKPSSKKD